MIALEIQEKTALLARLQEKAKNVTCARDRITSILNVSIITSQLNYLLAVQKASNEGK